MPEFDLLIIGGGVAGMTAAAAFGTAGFKTLLVDPAPAPSPDLPAQDLRTTAFLQPARALLEDAGLWQELAPFAAPLEIMRIADASKGLIARDFRAEELSQAPFGWNFPNALLRLALARRLAALPTVETAYGTRYLSHLAQSTQIYARLSDGRQVSGKLLLAADGRASAVRQSAQISAQVTSYGQKALVFAATHAAAHQNASTEVHRTGGPFTLVPLPDLNGQPCSSVVWMERGPEAERLMALSPEEFSQAATERSGGILGALHLASPRQLWPIIAQKAARLTDPRLALIAEAAHVLPPIGAQGLNMSLADIACLLDLAKAAPSSLGSPSMLARYEKSRAPDIALRMAGVDLLNRASIAGAPVLTGARQIGIKALAGAAPVRRALMRLGLGMRP